jgi:hypothetical protein
VIGQPSLPPGAVWPKIGQVFPLTAGKNLIGRHTPQFTSATIDLLDQAVSRRHVEVECASPGVWEIEDLKSHNGTFINGQQIQPNMRRPLNDGDLVGIVSPLYIELRFCLQLAPGVSVPQPAQPAPEEEELPVPIIVRGLEPHDTAEIAR